jgi:hypothetical protein
LFGQSRQKYYRSFWRESREQSQSIAVIDKVNKIRSIMPHLGTRKLYHLLHKELYAMNVGGDRLFSVLRANHLLIKPKKNYRITTDSRHRFKKHKNLMEGMQLNRPEQVRVSDIT